MLESLTGVISVLPRPTLTPLAAAAALSVLLVADAFVVAQPATAQQGFGNFFTYQNQRPRRAIKKKRATETEPTAAAAPAKKPEAKEAEKKSGPTQPVYIIVSLADQHATIYDTNGVVTRTRVSTGQAGHRTPTGVFSIIGKERWHRSNIYSGAPMPWMQRITWSGVAMHAGVVPGYPASHGCIRLPAGFAPQLYGMTKMGARVVVSPRDVQPLEFSHPLLPTPTMHPAPVVAASPGQQASKGSVELASIETAAVAAGGDGSAKQLNPIAYATALKQRATAEKAAADLAAKNALAAAQAAGTEARQALEDVRKAEADLKSAEDKLAEIEARAAAAVAKQPAATPAPASEPTIETERAAAAADIARAQTTLSQARAREASMSPAAFAAVETWKRAVAAAETAGNLVDEADRRREQVSVFISKKEGRIFIRQAWKDVWEAPVTIRDPERPLGTHVYSAIEPAADGSSMRWIAISMPPESTADAPRRGSGNDKGKVKQETPQSRPAAETAAGALDRIELPEGARERISELLWTGGSLIVSDNPRSYEMSDDATDFIVLTR